MGKCESGNNAGSVILDRPLKLWSLIIDSLRCGSRSSRKHSRRDAKAIDSRGSEKLSELLKQAESSESDGEVRRKEQALQVLKDVARKVQQMEGSLETVVDAAAEIRRLTKDDPQARITLALLGVIPPLVAMLDVRDLSCNAQVAALYALLNLAIANNLNKAAIVKAGAVHKMLKLIQSPCVPATRVVAEAVVANFLGLSALDSNKPIIGSSGAIPFLVETLIDLGEPITSQAKHDALRALYNLSISPSNVSLILETDLIPHLFTIIGEMDMSERILSVLCNVVSVSQGRKAISAVPDAFPVLIDILDWTDTPVCQEKACYILMVMAHKSYEDRRSMIESGIVSSLLELTLLGSTLSQKRASRMLESLRVEKGKQVMGTSSVPLSAPICGSVSITNTRNHVREMDDDEEDDEMMSQEKKAVKQLVQQSLHNNMRRMVTRANLPCEFFPSSHFKALTSSSTSKSLPF